VPFVPFVVTIPLVNDLQSAVQFLKQARLVAFPTETVYGLGADATNPAAIDRIFQTKGRPSTNPLIVHVASIGMAQRCVSNWLPVAEELAQHFWPGPLTLVLPKNDRIVPAVTAGLVTVAVRVPNHPLALALLRAFDGPLAAPSANRSSHVSPTTAQHVLDEFPDSQAAGANAANEPAMILDGGPCAVGIESTVLDLTTSPPTILRPGGVTPADLEPILGPVRLNPSIASPDRPTTSPGQHPIHYAPRTPAYRFETSQRGLIHPDNHGLVILSPLRVFKEWGSIIAMPNDPAEYAQHLYAVLRNLDTMNLQAIFIEIPPDVPQWAAIRDRLIRATQPLPV
jgi:L-threonylcarbamoyladenylate synthase